MNDSEKQIILSIIEKQLMVRNYVVIAGYVLVFLIALIANVLIIWVIIREQFMRNVTNYFLVNLSVADLMVTLVCMPKAAYMAYSKIFYFGNYTCKITAYFQCIAVASSVFTITTMSVDRYLAINKPFGIFYRCFNKKTTLLVIVSIWLLSLLLFLPILFVSGTLSYPILDTNVTVCTETWTNFQNLTADFHITQKSYGITLFICIFALPGLIMLFAYSMMSKTLCSAALPFDSTEAISCTQQRNRLIRGRKRVAYILLLLAFVFAGCWLPYHIVTLIEDLKLNEDVNFENIESGNTPENLEMYLLLLGHVNSALNPIIYCALSKKYRRSIKDLISTGMTYLRSSRSRNQWMDSSASGTQLHYSQRLKTVPTVQNQLQLTLSRLQSSQKTTKTCAV